MEVITQWENYVALCIQNDSGYLGDVWVYIDATTMKGKTDEEEYRMYEEVYRDEMGGEALLYVYYLDEENFQQAEKVLEISAPYEEGSRLDKAIENQPYFGTIMRSGSTVFDDSLETI